MKPLSLFLSLLVLALSTQAQSVFKMIYVPGENTPYASQCVRASDDGFIVELRLDSGDMVWRGDADGNPIWCKKFTPEQGGMTAMPDGGFVFTRYAEVDQINGTYEHELVRVDVNGDVVWSKNIMGAGLPFSWLVITAEHPLIASDGIVIVLFSEPEIIVEKIAFDGTPLWSTAIPVFGGSIGLELEVTSSMDGRIHLICDGINESWWNVITLEADGELLWHKRYGLTNGFWETLGPTAISGFLGQDVIISGRLNSSSLMEDYDFLARLDPLGQVRWMNFYDDDFSHDMLVDDNGTIYFGGARDVLDSNGIELSGLSASLPSVTENDTSYQYVMGSTEYDLVSQHRWQAGRYRKEDQTFGVIRSMPVIVRIPWNYGNSCYNVSTQPTVDPLVVPPDVQSIEDGDTAVALTLSSEDIPWTSEDITLFQTVDHCTSISGIDPDPTQEEALLVSNTVIAGSDLQVRTSAASHVEVFDMTGKLITRSTLNGAGNISTRSWPSGAYIVKTTSLNGSNVRTARVAVL